MGKERDSMRGYVKITRVCTYRGYMIGHFVTPVTDYYKFRRATATDMWSVCEFSTEAEARECIDEIESEVGA